MAKDYAAEMAKLIDTFVYTKEADIKPLVEVIRTIASSPLLAIGSGGSLTVAHALASSHRRSTTQIATAVTPLEVIYAPLSTNVSTWLISAGGNNADIIEATSTLIKREHRQVVVLSTREDSPLAKLCCNHGFVDCLIYPLPAGKDGFLATNSLLGFTLLLARAYTNEFESPDVWGDVVKRIESLLVENSEPIMEWKQATQPLWTRPTILVIYGTSTYIGALDLESKFTEAALGNIQLADYRNFAHGRHHWLAKRGQISTVLALVSDTDRTLADRTLALIPESIPRARLEFGGSPPAAALASLVAALRITEWAGAARKINPGGPGVPEFGRKLYRLRVPKQKRTVDKLSGRDAAAITRKTDLSLTHLKARGDLEHWRDQLNSFRAHLCNTAFAGVVLDYDGTIVDTRHRFKPPNKEITDQLIRIIETGVLLAIATGRGQSVRKELQKRIPSEFWSHVLIGYYNGAEVASLGDDATPDGSDSVCKELAPIAKRLRAQPELIRIAEQSDRKHQITLHAKCGRTMPENRLWGLVQDTLSEYKQSSITITRSGHSVDVLAPGTSKLNVLDSMKEKLGEDARILTIGDRGRWPGNDYELLHRDYALSVDETNMEPSTCWNLAPCGQRGPAATLIYLEALSLKDNTLRFRNTALR